MPLPEYGSSIHAALSFQWHSNCWWVEAFWLRLKAEDSERLGLDTIKRNQASLCKVAMILGIRQYKYVSTSVSRTQRASMGTQAIGFRMCGFFVAFVGILAVCRFVPLGGRGTLNACKKHIDKIPEPDHQDRALGF